MCRGLHNFAKNTKIHKCTVQMCILVVIDTCIDSILIALLKPNYFKEVTNDRRRTERGKF